MELYSYDGFIRILDGLSSLRSNIILYLTIPNNEIRPVNVLFFLFCQSDERMSYTAMVVRFVQRLKYVSIFA